MALIKCPDCGKQISDKAVTCIHCGRPMRSSSSIDFSHKTAEELLSEQLVKESYEKHGWIPFLW